MHKHRLHTTQAPMLEIHELPNYEIGVTFKYTEEVKESLKETFAASDGRAWDPDLKMWRFPVELQEEVKEWALSLFDESEIRFPGQASFVRRSCLAPEAVMCLYEDLAASFHTGCAKLLRMPQTPDLLLLRGHSFGPITGQSDAIDAKVPADCGLSWLG